jgi:ligand-binding sensor domain-containing protein
MKKFTFLLVIGLFLFINYTKSQTWTTYTTANGLAENDVTAIAVDKEGNKWFGTDGGGVSKFDGINWTTYTNPNGDACNFVYSIAIDAQGNKWFGTWGGGVSKFDGTNWTTYTTADGLANSAVYTVVIDAQGNKWVGTYYGISEFDGTNWTTYTTANSGLVNDRVSQIAIDAQGNKWFGTEGGVSKFDGINWTNYTYETVLIGRHVSAIAIDVQGNKWFGTEGGVSKFDGSNWTTYTTANSGLENNYVVAIVIDVQGNKWFGTYGGGVSKFDGTNWKTYTAENSDLPNNFVGPIVIDGSNNIWMASFNVDDIYVIGSGVSKFDEGIIAYISTSPDNQNISFEAGNTSFSVSSNSSWTLSDDTGWLVVNPIRGSGDGTITVSYGANTFASSRVATIIIIGSGKSDTVTVTQEGVKTLSQTWTTYTTADGLTSNNVTAIAIDSLCNKWFGTDGGGVSKFDGTNWTTYTAANGTMPGIIFGENGLISIPVNTIAIDTQGNKWFGTSLYGVLKFDSTNWTTYDTHNSGLVGNFVSSIVIDAQGNKWFGTNGGVSKFDGTNWTTYTTPNTVHAIAIDAQGNKWFGTGFYYDFEGGVSKFDGTNWTTYTTANGLASNFVTAIAIDPQGNKWFGTWDGGVSKFDGTNWITYSTANGLVSITVNTIAIDIQGNKWFGTDEGVSKFDGTNWTTYTTANGLANNSVLAIAIDAQGNKWFGTGGGVSKLDERIIAYISTSPDNQNISFEAGNTSFSVSSNSSWTLSDDAGWLVVNPIRGSGDGTITVSYGANTFASSRVATIIIIGSGKSDTVTVTQEGVKILSVSPINQDVSYEVGDTTFSISSNTGWTISDDADWLTVSPISGNGDGTITVSYTANILATSRVATITISGTGANSQSVTVTQLITSDPSLDDLKVTIYPNPVKDYIFIKLDDKTLTDIIVSVFDALGRSIIDRNFEHIDLDEEETLDLSFMKSGLYFLEIRSERNSKVYKIIKE